MNCLFCHNPCSDVRETDYDKHPIYTFWKCYNHPTMKRVEFVQKDAVMHNMEISLIHRGREYEFRIYPAAQETTLFLVMHDEELQYTWMEPIKQFASLLPITPENACEKLQLLLVFS